MPHEVKGEVIVVFCVLRSGRSTDAGPAGRRSRAGSSAELGKPLKPDVVVVVPTLPKTRSGKIMRRVARAACLGLDPGDISALEDPRAVAAIREAASVDPSALAPGGPAARVRPRPGR